MMNYERKMLHNQYYYEHLKNHTPKYKVWLGKRLSWTFWDNLHDFRYCWFSGPCRRLRREEGGNGSCTKADCRAVKHLLCTNYCQMEGSFHYFHLWWPAKIILWIVLVYVCVPEMVRWLTSAAHFLSGCCFNKELKPLTRSSTNSALIENPRI